MKKEEIKSAFKILLDLRNKWNYDYNSAVMFEKEIEAIDLLYDFYGKEL